jgi:hypothetical protein
MIDTAHSATDEAFNVWMKEVARICLGLGSALDIGIKDGSVPDYKAWFDLYVAGMTAEDAVVIRIDELYWEMNFGHELDFLGRQ